VLESQIKALFDTSPLHQFSKFNNFLLGILIFRRKNLFNFVTFFMSPLMYLQETHIRNSSKNISLGFLFTLKKLVESCFPENYLVFDSVIGELLKDHLPQLLKNNSTIFDTHLDL
jgi:hypothetical protein